MERRTVHSGDSRDQRKRSESELISLCEELELELRRRKGVEKREEEEEEKPRTGIRGRIRGGD